MLPGNSEREKENDIMSDALNDIAADERRAKHYDDYVEALLDHIEGQASVEQVVQAARQTDGVSGGYWGGRTNLSMTVEDRIEKLRSGDEKEWSRLLEALSREPWSNRYHRAKALSPWRDRLLIHVNYGMGFNTIRCPDLDAIVARADMKTYDCDHYTIVVKVTPEEPGVVWTGCGILGQEGPREVKHSSPPPWRENPDHEQRLRALEEGKILEDLPFGY